MIFKNKEWENFFELDVQKINILAVEDKTILWEYCIELIKQSKGEAGNFCLLKNFEEQSIAKLCCVETDIFGLNLNSKKMQMALIKKCVELSTNPEFEERLRNISCELYDFCMSVCQDVGYSIEIEEDIDVSGLFKLFSLSLKDSFNSLLEKLIEYVNITSEFLKINIYVFLFLSKLLSSVELNKFFEHCKYQGLNLILIEEAFPNFLENNTFEYQSLIIDSDGFEIIKNCSK